MKKTVAICRALSSSASKAGDTITVNGAIFDARAFRCTRPIGHRGSHGITMHKAGANKNEKPGKIGWKPR